MRIGVVAEFHPGLRDGAAFAREFLTELAGEEKGGTNPVFGQRLEKDRNGLRIAARVEGERDARRHLRGFPQLSRRRLPERQRRIGGAIRRFRSHHGWLRHGRRRSGRDRLLLSASGEKKQEEKGGPRPHPLSHTAGEGRL